VNALFISPSCSLRASPCDSQDIEATLETDERLRPGCSAVFSVSLDDKGVPVVDKGPKGKTVSHPSEEGLVCVAEVRNVKVWLACEAFPCFFGGAAACLSQITVPELNDIVNQLRRKIQIQHGVSVSAILLLKPHQARKVTVLCSSLVCLAFSNSQYICSFAVLWGGQTTSGKIARKHNLKAYLDRFAAIDVRGAPSCASFLVIY
jgi:hypothetical protein